MGDFVTSVRDDMFAMRWNFYAVVFAACWCRGRAGQVTGVTLQLRRNLDLVASGHLAAAAVCIALNRTPTLDAAPTAWSLLLGNCCHCFGRWPARRWLAGHWRRCLLEASCVSTVGVGGGGGSCT